MAAIDPPPPPGQAHTPSAPLPILVVADTTSALARLVVGARLEGLVLAGGNPNQVQIQTNLGILTVETNTPLTEGAILQLVLRALNPRTLLQITGINGRPPSPSLSPSHGQPVGPHGAPAAVPGAPAAPGSPAPASPASFSPPVTLSLGSTLLATVLSPAPTQAPAIVVQGAPGAAAGPQLPAALIATSGAAGQAASKTAPSQAEIPRSGPAVSSPASHAFPSSSQDSPSAPQASPRRLRLSLHRLPLRRPRRRQGPPPLRLVYPLPLLSNPPPLPWGRSRFRPAPRQPSELSLCSRPLPAPLRRRCQRRDLSLVKAWC